MGEFRGRWRYLPDDEKQIPLAFKYEGKPLWDDLKDEADVGPTGAAIAVALWEGHLIGKATSYSRNWNWYAAPRGRHELMSRTKVCRDVAALQRADWITHFLQVPGGLGWQSAMEATPALVSFMGPLLAQRPKLRLLRPREVVMLRGEDGGLIGLKRTREVDRMERKVEAFNEALCSFDIVDPRGVNLAAPVARIYNISPRLDRGGRFYGMGTCFQNIPSALRRTITIDGEPVAEVDYKTLHPALLYAKAGVPLPADCYDLGGTWPRDLVKCALLTLINAKLESNARHSIAHEDGRKKDKDTGLRFSSPDDKKLMQVLAEPGSQKALQLADALIQIIKAKHKAIAFAFGSDAGAALMRIDSNMAEAVMDLLMLRKGIACLPVHDSFLVPASKRDVLEEAMIQAAYEVAGLLNARVEAK